MPENSKHAGKEWHALALNLGELLAQIANNSLRHRQSDCVCGHVFSPKMVKVTLFYSGLKTRCLQENSAVLNCNLRSFVPIDTNFATGCKAYFKAGLPGLLTRGAPFISACISSD